MILYVARRCEPARFFGAVKLNKIIWKADFDSFSDRHVPVTGREYLKQQFGPALREMKPIQRDMDRDGEISFSRKVYADGVIEQRTIALIEPDLTSFSAEDMSYVDASIDHYWDMTGAESSDQSHGIAWETRAIGATMPYESARLSDRQPPPSQWARLQAIVASRGLYSE